MGYVLQASDGTTVADANAYVSVAAVRAHATDRGVDLTASADPVVQNAVIAATDFLDAAYPYVGFQLYRDQGTLWPRGGVGTFLRGLPPALVKATCILAIKKLQGTATLMPTPTPDPSGLVVSEVSKSVGPISTTTKFAVPSGGTSATDVRPVYPEVELLLRRAGLTASAFGGRVSRG